VVLKTNKGCGGNGVLIFRDKNLPYHYTACERKLSQILSQVTPSGEFYDQDINDDILNDRLDTRITDTGYYIAEQYAAAGYRGRFDIDFILSKGGQIFVSESNTRNTGGTDIALIAQKLIGKNFVKDAYTLNRSRLKIAKSKFYSLKTKQGLIINSENNLSKKRVNLHHYCPG